MTVQSSTFSRHSRTYSSSSNNNMDHSDDKEDRKREYNRLAQREFRRRRKEHLKNLEQAQKEQNSEQSEEIERLRYENDELRRENESLRAQLYGSSSSTHGLLSAPMASSSMSYDNRSYSLSPSASGASVSSSPPHQIGQDLSMASLSMTSTMLNPSMQAYDTSQNYSMVHPSGIRHDSISSPGLSGVRTVRSLGPTLQSLDPTSDSQTPRDASRRRVSGTPNILIPYSQSRAQSQLNALFEHYYSDLSITTRPTHHLSTLRSLGATLPSSLQPTTAQLSTPHYYGIDMIASPTLRDRLLTVSSDVAQEFIIEVGFIGGDDLGQLTIWGDEPLNEMTWEFSQPILERWGWLLGRNWVNRSNWWRQQRGAALLPEW